MKVFHLRGAVAAAGDLRRRNPVFRASFLALPPVSGDPVLDTTHTPVNLPACRVDVTPGDTLGNSRSRAPAAAGIA